MPIIINFNSNNELIIDSLSREQVIALVFETCNHIGWQTDLIYYNGLKATIKQAILGENEEFLLMIIGNRITLSSNSDYIRPNVFDTKPNHINIFIKKIKELESKLSFSELDSIYSDIVNSTGLNENDLMEIPDEFKNDQQNNLTISKAKSIKDLFIPKENYLATPIILGLNILLFIILLINGGNIFAPSNEHLINLGANVKSLIISDGEYWRLILSTFVHGGIFHLIMNMYALVFIGTILEPIIGFKNFVISYFLTGLFASISSIYFHDVTISVGASGAIFGLFGVSLSLFSTNFYKSEKRKILLKNIGLFVLINLIYGLKGNIDNAAHLGGLVTGILIGYIIYFSLKNDSKPILINTITFLLEFGLIVLGIEFVSNMPDNLSDFNKTINEIDSIDNIGRKSILITRSNKNDSLLVLKEYSNSLTLCQLKLEKLEKDNPEESILINIKKLKNFTNLKIEINQILIDNLVDDTIYIDKYNLKMKELESFWKKYSKN